MIQNDQLTGNTLKRKLLLLWVAVAIISLVILIPNTDDVSYYLPALSYIANGHMAVPVGQAGFEYVFYNLPLTSFIESGFYMVMTWLHIPLNFYTYRIPIAIFFIGTLILACGALSYSHSFQSVRQLLFCSLVGITLFAQCWMLNRPEIVGVFFLMGHLLSLYKWREIPGHSYLLFVSGFCLGILPALHPQFVPVAAFVFLVDVFYLYRDKHIKKSVLFIAPMMLPVMGVLFYFYHHAPFSWHVLKSQSAVAAQHSSWFRTIKIMLDNALSLTTSMSKLLRLINIIYYLPTLLMSVVLIFVCLKRLWNGNKLSLQQSHAVVLFLSALFILIKSWGSPYTISVCGFYILFAFIVLMNNKVLRIIDGYVLKHKFIVTVIMSFLVVSYIMIHVLKFTLFPSQYIFPQSAIKRVYMTMDKENLDLLILRPQYVPLFTDRIYAEYHVPRSNQKIYWVLPSSGQLVELAKDRQWGRRYLSNVITARKPVLVMTHHPSINDKKVILSIAHSQLKLSATVDSIVYNVDYNAVLKVSGLTLVQNSIIN